MTNKVRQLRVLLAFLRMNATLFLQKARDIVVSMTGNANYPTPFPALGDITTALDDLDTKITAAAGRDRTAIAARNASAATAKSLMRQLASYVQMHCLNDLTILLSSGFLPTRRPAPIGSLIPPQNVRTKYNGTSGSLFVIWDAVYGVRGGYTLQQSESATGPFTTVTISSGSRFLVKGLTPGQTYWFRVCANGANKNVDGGPSGWSNVVSVIAI